MTYEEILKHCDKQVERLEQFADAPVDSYNRREYDEHKMVADLIRESGRANKVRPRVSYNGMVAWSHTGENNSWNPCHSEAEALREVQHDDPGKLVAYLADCEDVTVSGSANVDYIIETIAESCDIDLDDVTDEQYKVLQERLDNVIANWINEFDIGAGHYFLNNIRQVMLFDNL